MGYRLSRRAEDDIIHVYVTGLQLFGVTQAERYQVGLERAFEFVAGHPLLSFERTEITPPVRVHRYKAHIVVYVVEGADVPRTRRLERQSSRRVGGISQATAKPHQAQADFSSAIT